MKTSEDERSIEYYPYPGNTFLRITLYKPRNEFGSHWDAEVNWGCHGAETPDNAELYGKAIVAAAKKARQLNIEYQQANAQQAAGQNEDTSPGAA